MEQSKILVDMTLKAWSQQISRAEKFFEAQSDDNFSKEVAPGKNRISYLMGHLVSSNESMLTLFGFGPRLHPSYEEIFSKNPDKALAQPPVAEIRKAWKETHDTLWKHFEKLTVNEWLDKHTAMTAEDLVKEPTRNKLSVLISRTNHVAYHFGQLVLAKTA
jgi:hypothetical protein